MSVKRLIATLLSALMVCSNGIFSLPAQATNLPEQVVTPLQAELLSDKEKNSSDSQAGISPNLKEQVALAQVPFVPNQGQIEDEQVKFYAQTFAGPVYVTGDGLTYVLNKAQENEGIAIKEGLIGGKTLKPQAIGQSSAVVSYYLGNESSKYEKDLPAYEAVNMGEIYDHISLELKAYGNNVEKIFNVSPGGDPAQIRFSVSGANSLTVDAQGELELATDLGTVKMTAPVAYQIIDGQKKAVNVTYAIQGNTYGFQLGTYDKSYSLVIDPLLAATYLGGGSTDNIYSIALDGDNNVYVAGQTASANFPKVEGEGQYSSLNGTSDIFVAKLSPDLKQLLATTYFGGSKAESISANSLVLEKDASGKALNVYVAGSTQSIDFPITTGSSNPCGAAVNQNDFFVFKLDGDHLKQVASTRYGGSGSDQAFGIGIDPDQNIIVAGRTASTGLGLGSPVLQSSSPGGTDCLIVKMNTNLVAQKATYLGGTGNDALWAMTVGPDGKIYLAGSTDNNSYPVTTGATFNKTVATGFISILKNDLSGLVASTFLGGDTNKTEAEAIAVDGSNNVYVTGYTLEADFKVTNGETGAYQMTLSGGQDVFATKLDGSLNNILASTYLGGSGTELGRAIAADNEGNIYVAGYTQSADFPPLGGNRLGDDQNGFIFKLNANMHELLDYAFVGGSKGNTSNKTQSNDQIQAMALNSSGGIYVAGLATSGDLPTQDGYQQIKNYNYDSFIAQLNLPGNDSDGNVLSSIYISNPATKTVYDLGDNLDLAGLVVTGVYRDGHHAPISVDPADVTGFDSSFPDLLQTLNISIEGKTVSYSIEVKAPPLTGIVVTKPATKTVYNVGDALDLSGLEVQGTYASIASQIIPVTASNVTGFDSSSPQSTQTLTINVEGYTAQYNINIKQVSTSVFRIPDMAVGHAILGANNHIAQSYGGDNAQALGAWFTNPSGIAFDGKGNLFIADTNNNRIREVAAADGISLKDSTVGSTTTRTGYIYSVAGTGFKTNDNALTFGFSPDGTLANNVNLVNPVDVAFDSFGNLVIAETRNVYNPAMIRVVAANTGNYYGIAMETGKIYTIAGGAAPGYWGNGVKATNALISPSKIIFDSVGNLLIVETNNHCVRMVAAATGKYYGIPVQAGNIYSIAGQGLVSGTAVDNISAVSANFNAPSAIAVDKAGNVYIADSGNNCIRVIDSQGIIKTVASQTGITALAVDSRNNLYVGTSTGNLYKAESTGTLTQIPVTVDNAILDNQDIASNLGTMTKMIVDPQGNLYVIGSSRLFYVQLDETPGLSDLTVSASGALPEYTGTDVNFDLSTLTLSGKDKNGDTYDLTDIPVSWKVISGSATVTGDILTINGSGKVYITATVNRVTSDQFLVADSAEVETQLKITLAATEVIGQNIVLTFNKDVDAVGAAKLASQFKVKVDGAEKLIGYINPGLNSNQLILTFQKGTFIPNTPGASQFVIDLDYTADSQGRVQTTDGKEQLANFIGQPVVNKIIELNVATSGGTSGGQTGGITHFDPVAYEVDYDVSDPDIPTLTYRFVDPVDYDNVDLALFMTNGFFDKFDLNLNIAKKVKLINTDSGEEVVLPNLGTVVNTTGGWNEMTDWYFVQAGGNMSPLGLRMQSAALKPSTNYVIEIDPGFQFRNGSSTAIKYLIEFTTAADSQPASKPVWKAGSSLTVSNVKVNGLTLNWTANAVSDNHGMTYVDTLNNKVYNNISYNIYCDNNLIGTADGPATSYDVAGLAAGQSYQLKVEAVDFAGNKSVVPLSTVVTTQNSAGQLSAPTLIPDGVNTQPGNAVNITFTDDPAWRAAVTSVVVDGIPITQYTLSAGHLQINAGVLSANGNHSIVVKATGYADASTTQQIISSGGGTPSDTTPPFWSFGSSLSGSKDQQVNANLTWAPAQDDVGVTEYRIYVSGQSNPIMTVPAGSVTPDANGKINVYVNNVGSGPVTLEVEAVDAAGNKSSRLSTTIGGTSQSFSVNISAISKTATSTTLQFDFTAGFMDPSNITNRLSDPQYLANLAQIKLYKKGTTTLIPYTTENYVHYGDSSVPADQRLRRLTLTYSGLEPGATYVVVAGSGIKANNGTALGQDYSYEFTVSSDSGTPGSTATLNSISITKQPTKLTYTVGDTLDLNGLEVTGTYSDGKTKVETVTAQNVTGFDSSKAANSQILTITVGGKTVTYSVTIKGKGDGSGTGTNPGNGTGSGSGTKDNPGTGKPADNQTMLDSLKQATDQQKEAALLPESTPALNPAAQSSTTVQTTDGVKVTVPAGALSNQSTSVRLIVEMGSITTAPKADTSAVVLNPLRYQRQFGLEGQTGESVQFNAPITITFPVSTADLAQGITPQNLAIYWWNPDKGDWVKLGGVYDKTTGSISVTTYHFSTYAVMADIGSIPERLAGYERYDTANAAADYGWKSGADQVVLVNAYSYADALAATPLAYKLNAPLLLTDAKALTAATQTELNKLAPKKIVLIGGTAVISQAIEDQLVAKYGRANVIRYGGYELYDTAALIAKALGSTGKAVIVNGEPGHYTDALAISSYAAYNGIPILFTKRTELPAVTAQVLKDQKVTSTVVVGGTYVIPPAVYNQLPGATRLGGVDAYETAALVASGLNYNLSQTYVATGLNFADALVAGNLAARTLSPILLVDREMPTATADFFLNHKGTIKTLTVVGGTAIISAAQESALRSVIVPAETGNGSGSGTGSGTGTGDGSGATTRPAEMLDFQPAATLINDGADKAEYRYNDLIPYDKVDLVWYFSFGFFSTLESNLKDYVKFYEKDTKTPVVLPNVVTVPINDAGHMEVTDWWFDRIGGHAPLGLTLKSTVLKPSTTYVIEIQAGFTFNNGTKTAKTYSFEFTTTAK